MKHEKKIVESPLKSYLVDAYVFTEAGIYMKIPGVISEEKCKKYAKNNHRMCEGRGVLNFDDGKVIYDSEDKKHVMNKWRRSCDCVNRKLEKHPYLIG